MYFCIPGLSYWKIPTVSPRWNNSYVFKSSIGNASGSKSISDRYFTNLTVSFIKVRVFSPKKSILSKPALSTTELSNWVTYKSESLAVATGTKLVISSGVMITPQAWIPVLRKLPSSNCACCKVSDPKSCAAARAFNSFTFSKSSGRKAALSLASSSEKILAKLMLLGMSLAILSASNKGKSNTRAVSRIADLAAMVP